MRHRQLQIWQKGMDLVKEIYALSLSFPSSEQFALTCQLNRAVISIPSNIAEGYGRNTTREYIHFLTIARGSRYELETQLILCAKLGYVSEQDISLALHLGTEVAKMLNAIIKKLSE